MTDTINTPAAEQARLEQLKKIMLLIEKLELYIDGDKRLLLSETAAAFPDIRHEAQLRIKNRVYLINRLRSYYAKKVFKLASDTYNKCVLPGTINKQTSTN